MNLKKGRHIFMSRELFSLKKFTFQPSDNSRRINFQRVSIQNTRKMSLEKPAGDFCTEHPLGILCRCSEYKSVIKEFKIYTISTISPLVAQLNKGE